MSFQKEECAVNDNGFGYHRDFKYDGNIYPGENPSIERMEIIILGDKNSGKTTVSVSPIDNRYANQKTLAKTLGLISGIFRNIEHSLKKVEWSEVGWGLSSKRSLLN